MKVAYVKWLDARGVSGGLLMSRARKISGLITHSAGVLVGMDKYAIRLAQDMYTIDNEDGPIARDMEIIPMKYVITKRIIEIEEKK